MNSQQLIAWIIVFLSACSLGIQVKPTYLDGDEGRCVLISKKICQDVVYNLTIMPTWLGISSQDEARTFVENYLPLLNSQCSSYLRMFLCSVYFPMCSNDHKQPLQIRPCRALCTHVQVQCEAQLQKYKLSWPKDLVCDKLPSSPELCLQPKDYTLDDLSNKQISPSTRTGVKCTNSEVSLMKDANMTCAPYCDADLLYRKSDKRFAQTWILVWSVICLFSASITMLTFLTDKSRFQYPERPVAFLAMCYFAYACAILLRVAIGYHKAGCHSLDQTQSPQSQSEAVHNAKFLIRPGFENAWCTIIALTTNYFTLAANLWWVMLGISWFLSAFLKWSHEGVDSISSAFHLVSWSVPAIQAILALILHRIDADELTGLCSVGHTDPISLLYFVIIPQLSCLVVGLLFMLLGFMGVFRIRKDMKAMTLRSSSSRSTGRKRLERLIAKLGVYTVLYGLPSVFLLSHYFYDFYHMNSWFRELQTIGQRHKSCMQEDGLVWIKPKCQPQTGPSPEAGLLRNFTSLVIGITSGMWIWANRKTMRNLKQILCCKKPHKPEELANNQELLIRNKAVAMAQDFGQSAQKMAPHSSSTSGGDGSSLPLCTKSTSSGGLVLNQGSVPPGYLPPSYAGYAMEPVPNSYLNYGHTQTHSNNTHAYNSAKGEDEFTASLMTEMTVSNKFPCV
ncbi:Frizzled-10 [Cichlidogyrus casuarinus]|uniref:Frizzled-10 n=1 Tax=Cichlidogyrus casuarinus TaxID=1844966 RepID=A0ABD2QN82_9PLAT